MSLKDDVRDISAVREEMNLANRAKATARKSQHSASKAAKAEYTLLLDTIVAECGNELSADQLEAIAMRVILRRLARRDAEADMRGDGSLFFNDDY